MNVTSSRLHSRVGPGCAQTACFPHSLQGPWLTRRWMVQPGWSGMGVGGTLKRIVRCSPLVGRWVSLLCILGSMQSLLRPQFLDIGLHKVSVQEVYVYGIMAVSWLRYFVNVCGYYPPWVWVFLSTYGENKTCFPCALNDTYASHHLECTACICVLSYSVVSDSLRPYGLEPIRLLRPWDSPGMHTGVVAIPSPGDLPDPGSNPCLLPCRWILYHLSHQGSPGMYWVLSKW